MTIFDMLNDLSKMEMDTLLHFHKTMHKPRYDWRRMSTARLVRRGLLFRHKGGYLLTDTGFKTVIVATMPL